jgi:hypothetical protein
VTSLKELLLPEELKDPSSLLEVLLIERVGVERTDESETEIGITS